MGKQVDIVVPAAGESVTEGILASWLKEPGSMVAEGDALFELETDKATLEVPAPASGRLSIRIEADNEVEVGQTVGAIESTTQKSQPLGPAVRRIVAEHSLDPTTIEGSGKAGRITKADALAATEMDSEPPAAAPTTSPTAPAAPPAAPSEIAPPTSGQRRVKMTNLRKRIAQNLVHSKQTSAHLSTFNEIDMSEVIALRTLYRQTFEEKHGVRLGFMSFFVTAACQALRRYPGVNAFIDDEYIIYNDGIHISVAISSDRGLIVPVIRHVERKGFATLESEIAEFADKAREKRIMPDELIGGTFTITNGGVFGSMLSTPIPNPPQTAILGMHAIEKRAVVIDDRVVVRPMMYVALTYDHRLIDGREAVGFLKTIKESIEEPARLMLEL